MKKIGLTDEEVLKSREQYGTNSLTEVETETFWDKFKENLGDPMIKILCVALIINVILTFLGQTEWYESVGIAVAVALATFVSTFSEFRNENSFKKLQEEASKIVCKVYRNGYVTEIFIDDIVKGDYILLQTGDKIPADGIMRDGSISVDQSVLNGESEEAPKREVADDYVEDPNAKQDFLDTVHVYRGTIVTSGNGVMEVTTIGDTSVYGKIASELQEGDVRESPLKVKLSKLAHSISLFGYIGGVAIAVAFLFQRIFIHNGFVGSVILAHVTNFPLLLNDIISAVILAVIIIVVAVPEGLPLMIAIVSAQNMGKMLKDNVLVREINGIETAGSLNLLFSDKTGTITKGQLEVVNFTSGDCTQYNSFEEIDEELSNLLSLGITQNSTAVIAREGDETKIIGGNGTDRAVLQFVPLDKEMEEVEQVAWIPFNSTNKYAATTVKGSKNLTLLKGAPEKIIEKCDWYFDANGQKQPFPDSSKLDDHINSLAQRAIRVLAVAVHEDPIDGDKLPEDGYTLVGVLGIRDEVRPESIDAIREVQNAGVQVVMITGDRKDTAVAIATEAGLLTGEHDVVLTSDELHELSDDEVKHILPRLRVVSRALPADKSRLVTLGQELNLVVGMTGDGVNDSPALKKADVGFAMGSGTEVAKEASDIVILDDNFNSIDKAILYGRTIYHSIRKFIIFQLTINVSAVLISFVCPLIGIENPLSITQFLWINLIMDTLAALAFGGEPALRRYMEEKPKRRDESIISKNMWSQILVGSGWTFVLSMMLLFAPAIVSQFRQGPADDPARYLLTGYFSFFVFTAVFNAFNARTDKLNLFENITKNHGFFYVFLTVAVIQVIMTYVGGEILRCYGLVGREWLIILAMAISIIPIDLIRKLIVGKKLD